MSPTIVRQIYKEKQLPAACKMNGQCAMVGQFSAIAATSHLEPVSVLVAASLVILHFSFSSFFLQALGLAYAPDGCAKLAKYFDTPRLRRPKCAPPADATCLRLFPGTICFRGRLIASFIAAILRLLSFVPRRRCQ